MKKITTINPIVEILLSDKEMFQQYSADLNVLLHINILTLDLFEILKNSNLISIDLKFETIASFYYVDGKYYTLNNNLAQYVNKLLNNENIIHGNLFPLLLVYYKEQIKNEIGNIDKYKLLYKEIIMLLMQEEEELYDWVVNATEIIINNEDHEFLHPIITQFYNHLNNENKLSNERIKLFAAIILIFLTKIFKQKKENSIALSACNLGIKYFEDIKDNIAETSNKTLFINWYGESYYERGKLHFEDNNFFHSIDDFYKSSTIINSYDTTIELAAKYQYVGFYKQSEVQLIKFIKWLEVDTEKNKFYKDMLNNQFLYELGKYYQNLGLYEEAVFVKKQHLVLEEAKGEKDLWYIAALRELGIANAKFFITLGSYSISQLNEAKEMVLNSIELFKDYGQEKYNALSFIYLAQLELHNNNNKNAITYLQDGFSLLVKYFTPNSKEYIEYYLSYADLLNKEGQLEQYKKLMHYIYETAKDKLSSHHIINRTIIKKLQDIDAGYNREILNFHYRQIERLLSPEIRTHSLEYIDLDDKNEIKNSIRNHTLSILPLDNNKIDILAYQLPFYENYCLLKLKFDTADISVYRFFLFKNYDNIHLIDYSNKVIFNVNEQEFLLNNIEDAKLYIKFFFDSIDGRHGKFLIVEETLEAVPWKYNIDNKEIDKSLDIINNHVMPMRFLFEEVIDLDGYENTLWHFSAFMFFKDSLFFSKIELNTKTGTPRLYDEKLVIEELQITVDIQSTIKRDS